MIWSIAWKNVWRNKIRSSIVIMAVTIGLWGGIFAVAVLFGMVDQRVRTAIHNEVSHIQLHNPSYEQNKDIQYLIKSSNQIIDSISIMPEVIAATFRQVSLGMINSATNSTVVTINAIDPVYEKQVSSISHFIPDSCGYYFKTGDDNTIIISRKLAEKLNAKLNSRIVLSFQSMDNNLVMNAYIIEGIYNTQNSSFDEANIYIQRDGFTKHTGLDSSDSHEIAVLLKDTKQTDSVAANLKKMFPSYQIKTWGDLQPELRMSTAYMQQIMWFVIIVLLLAMGFSIVNTMLMVVLERIKEIGVLMAIGMSKAKIMGMIMLETIYLSLCGGLLGMGIGFVTINITGNVGLDFSKFVAEGLAAVGFSSLVYPILPSEFYYQIFILVFLIGVFASIIPARKAIKLNPSEAIRES